MSEPISNERYVEAMRIALDEAAQARESGDVPVGAVLLDDQGASWSPATTIVARSFATLRPMRKCWCCRTGPARFRSGD